MKYGLALMKSANENETRNNGLFFASISQINHGGPDAVQDPNQMALIAGLNLKAGKLSIILSDYTTAFAFFENGISYLQEDRWTAKYHLSVNLYDAAAEAASALEMKEAVNRYTEELVDNSETFDDCLHCKCMFYLFNMIN